MAPLLAKGRLTLLATLLLSSLLVSEGVQSEHGESIAVSPESRQVVELDCTRFGARGGQSLVNVVARGESVLKQGVMSLFAVRWIDLTTHGDPIDVAGEGRASFRLARGASVQAASNFDDFSLALSCIPGSVIASRVDVQSRREVKEDRILALAVAIGLVCAGPQRPFSRRFVTLLARAVVPVGAACLTLYHSLEPTKRVAEERAKKLALSASEAFAVAYACQAHLLLFAAAVGHNAMTIYCQGERTSLLRPAICIALQAGLLTCSVAALVWHAVDGYYSPVAIGVSLALSVYRSVDQFRSKRARTGDFDEAGGAGEDEQEEGWETRDPNPTEPPTALSKGISVRYGENEADRLRAHVTAEQLKLHLQSDEVARHLTERNAVISMT